MKIYRTLILGLFLTVTVGCDDYLDLQPISEETSGNAYETASQIEAALVGAYESFQSSEYYVVYAIFKRSKKPAFIVRLASGWKLHIK